MVPVIEPPDIPPGVIPYDDPIANCDVDCGGEPPNDPNYSTPRTQPQNRTGEPGITLGSRNFNWGIPLVSLSGRSGLDLNISLSYNSLVWTLGGSMIKFNADQGFPGPGFRLGLPIIQKRYFNSQTGLWSYLMITPSGGRVDLRQLGTSNTYESFDSTYAQLTDNGTSLLMRTADGTQLKFLQTATNYICSEIKDRNGTRSRQAILET